MVNGRVRTWRPKVTPTDKINDVTYCQCNGRLASAIISALSLQWLTKQREQRVSETNEVSDRVPFTGVPPNSYLVVVEQE